MSRVILGGIIILLIISVIVSKMPQLKDSFLQRLPQVSNLQNQVQQTKVDPEVQKKQDLENFYNEISEASDKQEWSKLYDLSPQSVKNNVTREEFVSNETSQAKKNNYLFQKTTVNSIQVDGNKGTVDRTIIRGKSDSCTSQVYSPTQKKTIEIPYTDNPNCIVDNDKREFEYVNGKWQRPDPEPSERSLKAANYIYSNSSVSDQTSLLVNWGYGFKNSSFAVRNLAVYFDGNLEELIRAETWVENSKAEKSRPIYNQQPAQIIQQPAQQNNNSIHCTSSTFGIYTDTNCY